MILPLLSPTSAHLSRGATYARPEGWQGLPDPAAIVIIGLAVFLLGGLIARTLWQARLIRSFGWVLLLFCLFAALAWGVMGQIYQVEESPYRFAQLLTLFLGFVLILHGFVRFVLPAQASLTRAAVPPLVRNLAIIVLAFLVLFILLISLFPELSLTPVFFTSGVVSIVIGLAVQDVLSNLLAGLVLSLDRPFEIGDWVHVGDDEGEVVEVTWRVTRIRDLQGDHIEFPNSHIARERLINHHTPTTLHLRRVRVGVTYDTPPGLATHAMLEAAERVVGVRKSPHPEVHFLDYLDSSLLYELRSWIDNYQSYPEIDSDLRREIWYSFKRHDITIPFPIRDVNLRQVTDPEPQVYARLVATSGLPKGTMFELDREKITLGRDLANQIHLADPQVSGRHAIFQRKGLRYSIQDLESRHGTTVNGQAVTDCPLQRGDELGFGSIRLTFETNLAALLEESDRRPTTRPLVEHSRPEEGGHHREETQGQST